MEGAKESEKEQSLEKKKNNKSHNPHLNYKCTRNVTRARAFALVRSVTALLDVYSIGIFFHRQIDYIYFFPCLHCEQPAHTAHFESNEKPVRTECHRMA